MTFSLGVFADAAFGVLILAFVNVGTKVLGPFIPINVIFLL